MMRVKLSGSINGPDVGALNPICMVSSCAALPYEISISWHWEGAGQMKPHRGFGGTVASAAIVFLLLNQPVSAAAEDEIDRLLRSGQVPSDMTNQHGYSDFTDPLGRYLDLVAAGAFVEAKAIQPDACAAWLATRPHSAFSGRVWVWNT